MLRCDEDSWFDLTTLHIPLTLCLPPCSVRPRSAHALALLLIHFPTLSRQGDYFIGVKIITTYLVFGTFQRGLVNEACKEWYLVCLLGDQGSIAMLLCCR